MKKPITDSLTLIFSNHYAGQSIFNGGKKISNKETYDEQYRECSAVWLRSWLKNFGFCFQDDRILKP